MNVDADGLTVIIKLFGEGKRADVSAPHLLHAGPPAPPQPGRPALGREGGAALSINGARLGEDKGWGKLTAGFLTSLEKFKHLQKRPRTNGTNKGENTSSSRVFYVLVETARGFVKIGLWTVAARG